MNKQHNCQQPQEGSAAAAKSLSRVWLPATPWTAAYQAPPSIGFSRQEYWSGSPLPSPRSPKQTQNYSKYKVRVDVTSILYLADQVSWGSPNGALHLTQPSEQLALRATEGGRKG